MQDARLQAELEGSLASSVLPANPDARAIDALNDLLIRLRLRSV